MARKHFGKVNFEAMIGPGENPNGIVVQGPNGTNNPPGSREDAGRWGGGDGVQGAWGLGGDGERWTWPPSGDAVTAAPSRRRR